MSESQDFGEEYAEMQTQKNQKYQELNHLLQVRVNEDKEFGAQDM